MEFWIKGAAGTLGKGCGWYWIGGPPGSGKTLVEAMVGMSVLKKTHAKCVTIMPKDHQMKQLVTGKGSCEPCGDCCRQHWDGGSEWNVSG